MLDSAQSGQAAELPISAPLKWNAAADVEENFVVASETSGDEDEDPVRKKRKKRHQIEQDRTVDLHTRTPQSTADFERMLLGSPNSSYLWLQFMAFQLQLSEIDKAREVGRRALKAINFREDQERLNVWIALLNLEIMYGTEVTLDTVFKEAARANDSKTIHWRLAALLDESQKSEVCCPALDYQSFLLNDCLLESGGAVS
jgi:rRNA biogenesis protein RRP5